MAENISVMTVQDIMRFEGINCWVMYCDEHSDPYFAKIFTRNSVVPAMGIITQDRATLIVHTLDADSVIQYDNVNLITYGSSEGVDLESSLIKTLSDAEYPPVISFTYSTLRDAQVDILGVGLHEYLTNVIGALYGEKSKSISFNSADRMVYAFMDRKQEGEIERMRLAARRALEILTEAFLQLESGMTEKDAVRVVHDIFDCKPAYFDEMGVVREEYAWDEAICPVVLAGPSFKKGGHASASEQVIEPGHTLYFDFGVKLTFSDGASWSSDIQRMGYILRSGESEPPETVKRVFSTLVQAIAKGMSSIRPGQQGWEADAVVRNWVLSEGFPDYDHSTGHAIGELAHNPGALLGLKGRGLAGLRVQPNAVYSMEPRIAIENGGSIEEMVLVTENGGVPLCAPQETLFLVPIKNGTK